MKPWAAKLLSRAGIRGLLLALLLPGIILLLLVDSWNDYRTLADMTKEAYDNGLLEPALVLESSVEIDDGGKLQVHTPVYAQALLESRAGLRKYFRIDEIDPPAPAGSADVPATGQPLLGMPELPYPPAWPGASGDPVFYDVDYRNEPVRAVALVRDLYHRGLHRQVLVIVAESTGLRVAAEEHAWKQEFLRDARMLLLVVVLVWLGVAWALRPLLRLRNEVTMRSPRNLTPLDASAVPTEVVPLVEAVNHHMARHRDMVAEQDQFLDDASHQLRTPVAIAMTQAQYALRESDPARVRESLHAIVVQLTRARRLTEQLLTLAHADRDDGACRSDAPAVQVDLHALAREVVLQYLPLAHEKSHDLGLADGGDDGRQAAGTAAPVVVRGQEAELQEVLSNLLHNAINYCPAGSRITVAVGRDAGYGWVSVRDNGPGLAPALRERAFARFDRAGMESRSGNGSGLGLAIARAYARRNGGDVHLADGDPNPGGGVGLCATLRVPLAG